ncbi:thioesterase II family protein [Streptomyces sp. NPDC048567]|uniref:thioesterase II family protein n=1 Tax=Streptomyces sp. NPDC048567 TaxID=3365570 RepID=UPI00371F9458
MHRWLHPSEAGPDADIRLFLLHHSGGAATAYRDWPALFPGSVTCQAVQLPGRQDRRGEEPYTRLAPLVGALADVLAADLDERPYALFGHSMGALLAYRVTVELARTGVPAPALLAVSGWSPQGFHTGDPKTGDPYPSDPLALTTRLDSLPVGVAADPRLLDEAVRTLRADGAVCADHTDDRAAVPCPLVAYTGRDDPLLAPEALHAWAGRTPDYLGCRTYPGGHFYLHTHTGAVTADLGQLLLRHAEPR